MKSSGNRQRSQPYTTVDVLSASGAHTQTVNTVNVLFYYNWRKGTTGKKNQPCELCVWGLMKISNKIHHPYIDGIKNRHFIQAKKGQSINCENSKFPGQDDQNMTENCHQRLRAGEGNVCTRSPGLFLCPKVSTWKAWYIYIIVQLT